MPATRFNKHSGWLIAIGCLLVVWVAASLLLHVVRNQRVTADKVVANVRAVNFSGLDAAKRKQFLEGLASQLNRLEFDERQKLQVARPLEPLIREMTEAERVQLLEATLPEGFTQLMDSLNKMTPEQRKRFVQRGLSDLEDARKRFQPEEAKQAFDDATVQKFTQQGFESYLTNASAETKMDLAPLLEQIQVNLQGLRAP